MHRFTMVVGSTDGNTFRTEGKGRTTRVQQRHTSGPHEVPLPVDRLAIEAGLLLLCYSYQLILRVLQYSGAVRNDPNTNQYQVDRLHSYYSYSSRLLINTSTRRV